MRLFRDDLDRSVLDLRAGHAQPTERIELCLCASGIDDAVVTVAWFRQSDGLEYVWRFVV